jgi:hypothetical protein
LSTQSQLSKESKVSSSRKEGVKTAQNNARNVNELRKNQNVARILGNTTEDDSAAVLEGAAVVDVGELLLEYEEDEGEVDEAEGDDEPAGRMLG